MLPDRINAERIKHEARVAELLAAARFVREMTARYEQPTPGSLKALFRAMDHIEQSQMYEETHA